MIDCVVAPFDQVFPVADEDVKTTLPPVQKVVGPPAVIVGVVGSGVTVIVLFVEAVEVQPLTVEVTL